MTQQPNILMTLPEASVFRFGADNKVSLLRSEIRKGNLSATKLANKLFVTAQDLEDMDRKCRVDQKGLTSTSERKQKRMSYETVKKKSPQDAALKMLNRLTENSVNTLQTNGNPKEGATVVSLAKQSS